MLILNNTKKDENVTKGSIYFK